jgi:hypothetical protein
MGEQWWNKLRKIAQTAKKTTCRQQKNKHGFPESGSPRGDAKNLAAYEIEPPVFLIALYPIIMRSSKINIPAAHFATPILILVMGLILFHGQRATAQLNFKIGYDGAYSPAPQMNHAVRAYNLEHGDVLNRTIPPFHWLHGLNVGVRYRINYLASEISWESLGNRIEAVEINGSNAEERTVYTRLNNLTYSQELLMGNVGLGISAAYGFYAIGADLEGSSQKRNIGESRPFSTKFYLTFSLRASDILSIAIKPYYRYHWSGAMDTGKLNNYWSTGLSGELEPFHHFGIHFCFYNGPQ